MAEPIDYEPPQAPPADGPRAFYVPFAIFLFGVAAAAGLVFLLLFVFLNPAT